MNDQQPVYLSFLGIAGIVILLLLERIVPFRRPEGLPWPRWFRNFSLSFLNLLIVDQGFVILLRQTALFKDVFHFDLYGRLGLNAFWRIALTFMILDLTMYFWHRINHAVPFLWRFHRVHHSDLEVDVTTASRFHFGEMTISAVINYFLILSLGATIREVRIFKIVFVFMTQLSHSNVKLSRPFESLLQRVFVLPSMHRIHHSDLPRETDSNYGTVFSFWDRWFGTLVRDVKQEGIVFGLKEFKDPRELTLPRLVMMPFRRLSRK